MEPLTIGELIVAAIAATGGGLAGQHFAAWGEEKYGWDLNPWVVRQFGRAREALARARGK